MAGHEIKVNFLPKPLQWRHDGPDDVSNHQSYPCLLNRSFRRKSRKTSKLRVTGHLCREFTGDRVNSPHKWPVTRKMFPFDDVILHGSCCCGRPRSSHVNHIIQYSDSRNRSINLINNEWLLEGQFLIWLQLSGVKPTKQQNGLVSICISQSMSVIAYKAYAELESMVFLHNSRLHSSIWAK